MSEKTKKKNVKKERSRDKEKQKEKSEKQSGEKKLKKPELKFSKEKDKDDDKKVIENSEQKNQSPGKDAVEENDTVKEKTNIPELLKEKLCEKNCFYNSTICVDKTKLIEFLKCPLCKGFYRTPYTINECMHTFCKSCIIKWYAESNQRETCPVCDTKIGGRPLDCLIFDNNLSSLIDILFPQFEEIDKKNTKALYAAFREAGDPLPGDEDEVKLQKPSLKISIIPENSLPNRETKYRGTLLVQKNLDIDTIKVIISQKNNLTNKDSIAVKYKNREMQHDYTMDVIDTKYGFDQDKIIFYYNIKKKI